MRYSHFSLLALLMVIVAFVVPTFAAVEPIPSSLVLAPLR